MKKMIFIIVYICLGIVALGVRISLKEVDVTYYMSVINQFAGFATIVMILGTVYVKMVQEIKKADKSYKRLIPFCVFSVVVIIIYWLFIIFAYQKYSANLLNDIVTICSLTIALTTELYESLLLAMFYKG